MVPLCTKRYSLITWFSSLAYNTHYVQLDKKKHMYSEELNIHANAETSRSLVNTFEARLPLAAGGRVRSRGSRAPGFPWKKPSAANCKPQRSCGAARHRWGSCCRVWRFSRRLGNRKSHCCRRICSGSRGPLRFAPGTSGPAGRSRTALPGVRRTFARPRISLRGRRLSDFLEKLKKIMVRLKKTLRPFTYFSLLKVMTLALKWTRWISYSFIRSFIYSILCETTYLRNSNVVPSFFNLCLLIIFITRIRKWAHWDSKYFLVYFSTIFVRRGVHWCKS